MGLVSGTMTKYDAFGIREDLSDVIYNITPEDTPLLSGMSKGKVENTLFEWQLDSLAAVSTGNKNLEGDDAAFTTPAATTRVGNVTQISRKTLILSGTLEAVKKAGRKSELAYQIAKRGSEMKRDLEAIMWENLGGDAGGVGLARQTATLGAWVKSNVDFGTSGANPVYTSGLPGAGRTEGTQRAFTETILKSVAQSVWTSGGTLKNLFVGPVNKTKVSAFTGVVTRNYDISNRPPKPTAAIAAIDVYVTDFGTLAIRPSRFQRERDGWYIDFEYLQFVTLRPWHTEKLAKTGDAEKRMLLVEWGLKVKNEAALGLAADLTTA